jgi:hypothetical protein
VWAATIPLFAVVAGGGRGMLETARAQLYARWALFISVQAQTALLRAALLTRLMS